MSFYPPLSAVWLVSSWLTGNPVPHREEVVDNVEGAQKELLRYWSRVSSNRWLIAKMFGVLVRWPFIIPPPFFSSRQHHADTACAR